jgi:O-antigen/teichoic acid export membrane protein
MTRTHSPGVAAAASAGVWSAADLLFRQGAQFGIAVVLARLLTPQDFGVIALMGFFVTLVTVLVQNGFVTGLIQRPNTSLQEQSGIFWLNMGLSIVLALVVVAAAPAVSRFYAQPVLAPLLGLSAGLIVISALGAVHGALLNRDLAFRRLLIVGAAATLASGAVGIALAAHGYGAWALGGMMLASSTIQTAGLWLACRWRPVAVLHVRALGQLLRFGSWISLSGALDVLYSQGFSLLIGKIYGVSEVGLFNRAASTQQLPTSVLSAVASRVVLPVFSARADDPAAVRRGAAMAIGFIMLINLPAMLGLALCAPLVLEVLFGRQWIGAAPLLSILALGGILFPLHVMNLQIILAQGRSDIFFRLEIAKKVVGVICLAVGSFFGLEGLAWAQVVTSVLALGINTYPVGRMIGYSCARQLLDLKGLAVPAAVMLLVVGFLGNALPWSPILKLAAMIIAGALVYGLVGLLTRLRLFDEARSITLMLTRRGPA